MRRKRTPLDPSFRRSRPVLRAKQAPVSGDSPWWRWVMREIASRPGWPGTIRTIEEITQSLPRYPDGRGVMRGRVAARRLAPMLELVERGPNGSLGIGARYRIGSPPAEHTHSLVDEEWLVQASNRLLEVDLGKGPRWRASGSLG